jgi:hypothetical protein
MATSKKIRALLSPKMGSALRVVSGALKQAKVEFALVGGLALDYHADEPRFTRDLDFVVRVEDHQTATRAVKQCGFVKSGIVDDMMAQLENKDGVGVDMLFGLDDPEESARETAEPGTMLGVRLPIAKPEFLVWMYLISSERRHEEDAERLIESGKVDLLKLATCLRQGGSRYELVKLSGIVARVRGRR